MANGCFVEKHLGFMKMTPQEDEDKKVRADMQALGRHVY